MMKKNTAEELIVKYAKGLCSPEEKALVETGFLNDLKTSKETISQEEIENADRRIRANIADHISHRANYRKLYFSIPKISIAASLLIISGVALYFYKWDKPSIAANHTVVYTNDMAPGSNKAYLTLANGKKIDLSDAKNGQLAKQSGIVVTKTANGQLIYAVSDPQSQSSLKYNTIETPKGGQYQVRLPDGTNVWLNAASSLKYAVSFTSFKERKVELNGEAYFEVAKDKRKPFLVTTERQTIEVLGTHFNVNSYPDEAIIKTTLLEGSVKITANGITKILAPNQEADVAAQINILNVDTEEAIAWKNGYFMFESENIKSIMKKISRWYDVEVVFDGDVPTDNFGGTVSRFVNVSQVLKKLELTNKVHFKIEGRRITVMK